jgi:uncharacterized protein (DUF983 family)
MRSRCPRCGFRFEREEGYFLGAMLLSVIVAELLFVVGFVIALRLTWPSPPWTMLTFVSALAVVLFPLALYPFSRAIWLALDLYVQPARPEEHGTPEEPHDSSAA